MTVKMKVAMMMMMMMMMMRRRRRRINRKIRMRMGDDG